MTDKKSLPQESRHDAFFERKLRDSEAGVKVHLVIMERYARTTASVTNPQQVAAAAFAIRYPSRWGAIAQAVADDTLIEQLAARYMLGTTLENVKPKVRASILQAFHTAQRRYLDVFTGDWPTTPAQQVHILGGETDERPGATSGNR